MKKEKKISWLVIIVVSVIFFPVGVYLALKKLHSEPNNYDKNANGVIIYGATWILLGFFYLIGCTETTEEGVATIGEGFAGLLVFCAMGIPMILNACKYKKLVKTYKEYYSAIVNTGGLIDNVAAERKTTYEKALKTIETLIDKGLLGGRIDLASRSYVENQYSSDTKQNNLYSQPQGNTFKRIVKCPNCGANNQVGENGGVCEYCGSPIKWNN